MGNTIQKEGREPREEDRARGVGDPLPVADVVGTGSVLLCALMTSIGSPRPGI